MVLFSPFTIKYDITGDAVVHFLKLISLMLPCGQVLPDTLVKFKKFFSNLSCPLILHYYCTFCLSSISKNEKTCQNPGCLKELSSPHTKSYFVELPIVEQLRRFFARDGFYSNVQHRFKRKKKNSNNIEDIYDGDLDKKLFNEGIPWSPDNISFVMNTDGVPVF